MHSEYMQATAARALLLLTPHVSQQQVADSSWQQQEIRQAVACIVSFQAERLPDCGCAGRAVCSLTCGVL
jgi:hypothetical protein